MTLPSGARLGPFQIQAPVGAGGMGEVYRARDTRLGREVALKTLPPGAASDPDRRARFEQEARAASSLNHPNIITILDIGDADGISYIAMEYVEGRTLRELLAAGPLATRKLLDIAAQMAEGLAKAHAAGIVHRDLKPDNVIVSRDGFVKILDFGLAKLVQTTPEAISDLETVAKGSTLPGTLLGTVGYMSPEQARGEAVDFRSDQFSLGTILYEMTTGRRPFHGRTTAETMVAIIREEPEEVGQVNPRAPAPLRWILERCLAKDPDDRYASTRDLARDLAGIRDHLSEAVVSADALSAPRRRWLRRTALAGAGLAAGVALGALVSRGMGPARDERSFAPLTFRRGTVLSARFAPDGQTVVYAAAWEGNPVEIYSVRFDGPESRSLGLPSASLLSISSTGEMAISLGHRFVFGWESTGTLARAPLGGGAPRELLDNVQEADWAPDGGGLAIVRDGGERRRLEFPVGRVLYETAGWISHARFSPDGKRIAFVEHPTRGDNVGSIAVVDTQGSRKTLSPGGANGLAWSPRSDEVWLSTGFALDLEGRARRIWLMPGTTILHDVSRDGRVLLSRATWRREVVGRGPGQERESNLSWLDWSYPSDLSDDGNTLLFDEQNRTLDANYMIYLRKTDGSPAVRLGRGRSMGLSPDGKWVLASQVVGNAMDLVLLPTGSGDSKTLPRSAITYESGAWFPDGRRVVVSGSEPGHGSRLYVVEVPDGEPEPASPEGVTLYHWEAVSPDGRAVVAVAPDGTLWLYPIGGGEPRPVPGATREDVPIRWTRDGRALYVQRGSGRPTLVDILDVTAGARQQWMRLTPPDPAGTLVVGPLRLSADGRAYVYSYRRILDELYVADGLR